MVWYGKHQEKETERECMFSKQQEREIFGVYGMVWYGIVWYGMEWYGMEWYGMVWYGMVWVWYGMVWYGMVWYGMVWYGMAWHGLGLVFWKDKSSGVHHVTLGG